MVRRDPGKEYVKPNHRAAPPEEFLRRRFSYRWGENYKSGLRICQRSRKSLEIRTKTGILETFSTAEVICVQAPFP
nr:MAG TPA_asm: hypothetical protein [Bacteriophage sp.]